MRQYSLTEYGKNIIAIVIAIAIFLAVLITIIVITVPGGDAGSNGDHDGQVGGNQGVGTSGDQALSNRPEIHDVIVDSDEGTLSFTFTPDITPDTIDHEISFEIAHFLTSPLYTAETFIAVEIPALSDDMTASLTAAVVNALTARNVNLGDIVFIVHEKDALFVQMSFRLTTTLEPDAF